MICTETDVLIPVIRQVAFTNPERSNWSRNTQMLDLTTRTSTGRAGCIWAGTKLFNTLSPSPRFALLLRILMWKPLLCVLPGKTIHLDMALPRSFKWQE